MQNQFNMSVTQFETEVKAERAQHKLLARRERPRSPSATKTFRRVQEQNTKVKFDYAIITLDDVKKQIKPTDAELKAFYEQNKQRYVNSIPEKRKARYILIDTAKLAENDPGHRKPICRAITTSIRMSFAFLRRSPCATF